MPVLIVIENGYQYKHITNPIRKTKISAILINITEALAFIISPYLSICGIKIISAVVTFAENELVHPVLLGVPHPLGLVGVEI